MTWQKSFTATLALGYLLSWGQKALAYEESGGSNNVTPHTHANTNQGGRLPSLSMGGGIDAGSATIQGSILTIGGITFTTATMTGTTPINSLFVTTLSVANISSTFTVTGGSATFSQPTLFQSSITVGPLAYSTTISFFVSSGVYVNSWTIVASSNPNAADSTFVTPINFTGMQNNRAYQIIINYKANGASKPLVRLAGDPTGNNYRNEVVGYDSTGSSTTFYGNAVAAQKSCNLTTRAVGANVDFAGVYYAFGAVGTESDLRFFGISNYVDGSNFDVTEMVGCDDLNQSALTSLVFATDTAAKGMNGFIHVIQLGPAYQ